MIFIAKNTYKAKYLVLRRIKKTVGWYLGTLRTYYDTA